MAAEQAAMRVQLEEEEEEENLFKNGHTRKTANTNGSGRRNRLTPPDNKVKPAEKLKELDTNIGDSKKAKDAGLHMREKTTVVTEQERLAASYSRSARVASYFQQREQSDSATALGTLLPALALDAAPTVDELHAAAVAEGAPRAQIFSEGETSGNPAHNKLKRPTDQVAGTDKKRPRTGADWEALIHELVPTVCTAHADQVPLFREGGHKYAWKLANGTTKAIQSARAPNGDPWTDNEVYHGTYIFIYGKWVLENSRIPREIHQTATTDNTPLAPDAALEKELARWANHIRLAATAPTGGKPVGHLLPVLTAMSKVGLWSWDVHNIQQEIFSTNFQLGQTIEVTETMGEKHGLDAKTVAEIKKLIMKKWRNDRLMSEWAIAKINEARNLGTWFCDEKEKEAHFFNMHIEARVRHFELKYRIAELHVSLVQCRIDMGSIDSVRSAGAEYRMGHDLVELANVEKQLSELATRWEKLAKVEQHKGTLKVALEDTAKIVSDYKVVETVREAVTAALSGTALIAESNKAASALERGKTAMQEERDAAIQARAVAEELARRFGTNPKVVLAQLIAEVEWVKDPESSKGDFKATGALGAAPFNLRTRSSRRNAVHPLMSKMLMIQEKDNVHDYSTNAKAGLALVVRYVEAYIALPRGVDRLHWPPKTLVRPVPGYSPVGQML